MPRTLQGAPELSAAEREALAVLAEHARDRARLDCVWLFAHPPDPESDSAVELLAQACATSAEPLAEAAARAAVARTARGDRRRFGRAEHAPVRGTRVTTASREDTAVSAAGQPGEAAATPEGERALADLARVALRLAAGPAPAAPAAVARPAVREEPVPVPAPPADAAAEQPAAFGASLAASLALLQEPPILAQSRVRLVDALDGPRPSLGEAVEVIETDVGLALAVVAGANRLTERPRAGYASVAQAMRALGPRAVATLAAALPVGRAPSPTDRMSAALVRLAPHSLATRAAADLLALRAGAAGRDELRLAAVLHDIGKVALAAASPGYLERALDPGAAPEVRAERERRRLGIDHAGLGAIALSRLGMPRSLVATVERHHADDAQGPVALLRLADMLAHEIRGDAVDPAALAATGDALGIAPSDLRRLTYDLARAGGPRSVGAEPSPLTPMQQKVLQGLRRGLTYKQIAADLQVSESTVRSHLHKTYERLGVVDRAQAVLLAQDHGWV